MPTLKEYAQQLPETVREDYLSQLSAVENSLTAARGERDAAIKQVKSIPADAAELQGKVDTLTKHNAFLQGATGKGVRNPGTAWAVALTNNTFKEDGGVDWAKLKELDASLFGPTVKTPAGQGTDNPAKPGRTMSDAIRSAKQGHHSMTIGGN